MAKQEVYTVTYIILALLAFLMMYVIMMYPNLRGDLLNDETISRNTILIEDSKFTPEYIEIGVGGKIIWKNRDNVKHRLSFGEFSSEILDYGDMYSYTFEETGTYVYACEFQPGMTGTVVVK